MAAYLSARTLAVKNLIRNPNRTLAMALLAAVSAAVLFGSFVLSSSLKQGLAGMKERIGADLMIVPEGCGQNMESILLTGEPSYFYLDRTIEESVRTIDGVAAVTSQFYLASASESCCDFPVQIIGFDPKSDFIIQPWIKAKARRNGTIFAGSNISIEKGIVSFFAKKHAVAAKLDRSGSGMDNAVFADLATVRSIYEDAVGKGFCFLSDGNMQEKASAIFVRLTTGASPADVARSIGSRIDGVQVIQQGKFLRSLTDRSAPFIFLLNAICVLFLAVTVLALGLSFSSSLYERRREFSILRVLGADRTCMGSILLSEAALISAGGAACGIAAAAVILIPFSLLISQKLAMPFCLPDAVRFCRFAALTFVLLTATGLLSAMHAAVSIAKLEIYRETK